MKALTLYIDKWYIIGAVCTDGVPRLITPSNGEDRFWLYFYEDVTNETIVYGKDNKQHYHNNENHYYGDVFSLVTNTTASFMRYGRKQEMYKIFKASGIIDELKSAVDENADEVETFISFSRDISDAARLVFLQSVLEPDNFKVRESVARIGHLSLEHAFRKGQYSEDGYYLLLNACNENLSYSVYEHIDDIMLRKAEACLNGMGTDLRSRALLEKVVKNINQRNHFLDSEQDYEREYLRLGQFVDQWIVKLENAKAGRPITIPNVRFSQLPNTYDTTILKKDIDTRTHVIVDDIVREITNFVKNLNIPNDKVRGVIFLGNTFTNEQFIRAIEERYILSNDKYIFYKDTDLPYIVAVYSVMDCSQFSEATQKAFAKGATELERQKLAQEEEARRKAAEQEKAEQEAKDRAAREDEKAYNEAMSNVYDYEKKQDYAQMSEWADMALNKRPDDLEAKQKKAEATRLLSEKKVKEEQYKSIIQRAQKSLEEKQWQDALSQSDAALNLMPHSKEANRIHQVARKQIADQAQIDKFLTRADMFLAQKSYNEALEELKKVQFIDGKNAEAKTRIEQIEKVKDEHNKQVEELIGQYKLAEESKDFDTAISVCNKLIDTDSSNQRKWTEKVERLKTAKEEYSKEQERWQNLKQRIESALFMDNWAEVVNLGKEALRIRDDENLRSNIAIAEEKLRVIQAEENFKQSVYQVKDLIVDKKWDDARELLKELQSNYPDRTSETKVLFKQIFDAEAAFEKKHQKKEDSSTDDDFFGSKPVKDPQRPKSPKAPSKPKKTGDDFFDMDFTPTKNEIETNRSSKITNDDFNF
jgi:hypothetical protein